MYTLVYTWVHTCVHACPLMRSRYEPRRVLSEGITLGDNAGATELWARLPRVYSGYPEGVQEGDMCWLWPTS